MQRSISVITELYLVVTELLLTHSVFTDLSKSHLVIPDRSVVILCSVIRSSYSVATKLVWF